MIRGLFTLLALVLATPAHAAWLKAETEHFILYSNGAEKALREDAIKLERFDRLMRMVTGIGDDRGQVKLRVYFVRGTGQVESLYPGPIKRIAGFYVPSAAGAIAVVPRILVNAPDYGGKYAATDEVILFHEYAHHLMQQYFPAAYPAWYVEGFAEYVSNTIIAPDGMVKFGLPNQSRAVTLYAGTKLPIETLLTTRVVGLEEAKVAQLYARSWLLTHYLGFAAERTGQLAAYLRALSDGKPNLDAAKAAFGDLAALDKDLDRYLAGGKMQYRAFKNPLPEPRPFTVQALDEASGEAVLLQLRLTRGTALAEREPIAADLRKLAARYPASLDIATALAEAELDLGNYAASGLAADAALDIAGGHSRALLWKGLSLARQLVKARDADAAKWKEARGWIVKANRADPEDPLPLIEYYRAIVSSRQVPPQIAIDGLAKAQAMVPQDRGTRFTLASAFAAQKKFEQAIAVLSPAANDPHGGGAADYARKLITAIEKAKASGLDAALPEPVGEEEAREAG